MWLELPVRWTETDKENQEVENLIKGDNAKDKIVYTFGKLVIDAADIGPYYNIDQNNIMVNDRLGKVYCVTIPIDQFRKILTEVTGNAIMTISVKTDPIKDNPPSKMKPKSDGEEDILF